jgi:hypothetical protein
LRWLDEEEKAGATKCKLWRRNYHAIIAPITFPIAPLLSNGYMDHVGYYHCYDIAIYSCHHVVFFLASRVLEIHDELYCEESMTTNNFTKTIAQTEYRIRQQ